MNQPKIAMVVEGHGEVAAVPVLLDRIIPELALPVYPDLRRPPRRVGRDSLIKPGGVERTTEDVLQQYPDLTGLLILLDADDDCPAELGPQLVDRAKAARPNVEVAVVLANKEFEAWFLAAAASLAGRQGLSNELAPPPNPEGIRGCKEWLSTHRPAGVPYKPRQHQPGLAQAIDLSVTRQNAPSFDKFWRDVERLMTNSSVRG